MAKKLQTDRNAPVVRNIQEVAQRLGCSDTQVRRLIETGVLRAVNIGTNNRKSWRIPDDAIDAMLDGKLASA